MNHLIIGSHAMKHYFSDFKREPKDIDYCVEDSSLYTSNSKIEYLSNPILLKYQKTGYLLPDLIFTLKMSHIFYDINWNKHMFDIQFLLKKGYVLNVKLFEELKEYWKTTLPQIQKSNLVLNKEDFFNNAINYDEHEHDYLHTLLVDVPAYTKILKDGAEVELDENKFNNLSFEEKCDVVREETMIMAYERFVKTDYRTAYNKMLGKCIRDHFPEYIAIFAITNYIKLEKSPYNYMELINKQINK